MSLSRSHAPAWERLRDALRPSAPFLLHLHGDLSANSGYNALTRDPALGLSFLEECQDRLYFATDIAHMAQDLPIVRFLKKLRVKALLPETILAKIASQNADRLLGLGVK